MPVNKKNRMQRYGTKNFIAMQMAMSPYESLCVRPQMAKSVTSAPQCGTGSMPTDAMATMRCSASNGMP